MWDTKESHPIENFARPLALSFQKGLAGLAAVLRGEVGVLIGFFVGHKSTLLLSAVGWIPRRLDPKVRPQPDELIRSGWRAALLPGARSTRHVPPCPQAAPSSPPTTSSGLRWQRWQSATQRPTSPCPPTVRRPAPTGAPLASRVPPPEHEARPSSRQAVVRRRFGLQLRVPPVVSTRCARAHPLPGAQGLPRPSLRRSDLVARSLLPWKGFCTRGHRMPAPMLRWTVTASCSLVALR